MITLRKIVNKMGNKITDFAGILNYGQEQIYFKNAI